MSGSDDVAYHPSTDGTWIDLGVEPHDLLVLGDPSRALLDVADERGLAVRVSDGKAWEGLLHTGTYTLVLDADCMLLVVLRGLAPNATERARSKFVQGPLGLASAVFESTWSNAKPAATSCEVAEGDTVRIRSSGELGTVQRVVAHLGNFDVDVDVAGRVRTLDVGALDLVEGDPRDPSFWVRQAPGGADDLSLTLTWTKLTHPLTDTVYSFASSKTIFRAYQFAPVLKLLGSSTGRLLIADEVGLGKTIEAGLIWSELEQRSRLDRVLVVVPASLALKWKSEMGRRFDRDLTVMKPADLLAKAQDMSAGRDVRFAGVVSLESLRTATDALEALNEVHARLDLVIVDEAHALRNKGTRGYELGQLLSDWADVLLFLSATPLNLGQSDLFNLVNMLREDEFSDEAIFAAQLEPNQALNQVARRLSRDRAEPRKLLAVADRVRGMELGPAVAARPDFAVLADILDTSDPLSDEQAARAKRAIANLNTLSSVLTRTRKVDVPDAKALRVADQIIVSWTTQEREMYEGIRARYMQEFKARGTPPGFGMQMPLRQAASCLPAMQDKLRRRDPFVSGEYEEPDLGEDPTSTSGDPIDLPPTSMQKLLAPLQVDSKYEAMEQHLLKLRVSGNRQAMVFSFFRGTLVYLEERLSRKMSVRLMTGLTKMDERQRIMEDFRAGKFDVLLLSQVGAEGLDFEFCNVLVNYDLPWNPMQVEQRIGRLDRFGQTSEKIFIFNLHVPGTIESDIFERLYQRIGVFTESIGDLEPILRDELRDVTRTLLDPQRDERERRAEAERIGIAMAARAEQVKELEVSRGALSTIDQLEVDGMTSAGPTDGRFVGPSEIRRLLLRLISRCGGSLTDPVRGISRLRGSDELARTVLRWSTRSAGGSQWTAGQLAAHLRDEKDIRVTFDNDVASRQQVELISGRHPLVRVALKVLDESSLDLRRFGVVGLPGLSAITEGCLARVDLVESTGVRPRLELWVTSVDLETGTEVDISGVLLDALAHGRLTDIDRAPDPTLPGTLDWLERALAVRRRDVEAQRRADNDALVDARVASQLRSIDLKIARARSTLVEVEQRGRDDRVVRMHQGRIRNLLADRETVSARLGTMRRLDVSSTSVAVLQVHPV